MSSETWPYSGSTRSGIASRRPKSARRTSESGSSFSRGMYPTPAATPYGSQQNGVCSSKPSAGTPSLETWARETWSTPKAIDACGIERSSKARDVYMSKPTLSEQAKQHWPTPCTTDARSAGRHTTTTDVMHPGTSLTDAIRASTAWQTPTASRAGWNDRGEPKLREQARLSESARPTPTARDGRHGTTGTREQLPDATKTWATPCARDSNTPFPHTTKSRHPNGGRSLGSDAQKWATPTVADRERRGPHGNGQPTLSSQLTSWPTPTAGEGTGYMSGTNRDTWRPSLASAAKGSRPSPGRRPPTTAKPGSSSASCGPTSSPPSCRGNAFRKSTKKEPVLNAAFVEWLMGLPLGSAGARVGARSDPAADRTDKLRCLGNAAVPAEAELALVTLLGRALA